MEFDEPPPPYPPFVAWATGKMNIHQRGKVEIRLTWKGWRMYSVVDILNLRTFVGSPSPSVHKELQNAGPYL